MFVRNYLDFFLKDDLGRPIIIVGAIFWEGDPRMYEVERVVRHQHTRVPLPAS